jgi:hypothetical protein
MSKFVFLFFLVYYYKSYFVLNFLLLYCNFFFVTGCNEIFKENYKLNEAIKVVWGI